MSFLNKVFRGIGNNISNSTIISSNGKTIVDINGKKTQINSGNVSVINGQIFVDGKLYESIDEKISVAKITVIGDVEKLETGGSVTVEGSVTGDIDCGGSVTVGTSVKGDIDCGGSVTVGGDQHGGIDCGGSVKIGGRR